MQDDISITPYQKVIAQLLYFHIHKSMHLLFYGTNDSHTIIEYIL